MHHALQVYWKHLHARSTSIAPSSLLLAASLLFDQRHWKPLIRTSLKT